MNGESLYRVEAAECWPEVRRYYAINHAFYEMDFHTHPEMEIMYAAIAMGGHIRVGMGDNVMYSKGVLADCNAQFVERAVRVSREFGREIATPDEAREILGLKK